MKNSKMLIIAIPVNGRENKDAIDTIIGLTESLEGDVFDPQNALDDIYGALSDIIRFLN